MWGDSRSTSPHMPDLRPARWFVSPFKLSCAVVCSCARCVCCVRVRLTLELLCWSLKEECGHMAARTHAAVHAQAGLDGAVAARVTRVALLHNEHPLPLH